MAKRQPNRHKKLLDYLNRLAAKICPRYLRNDQDDIAQTVLIRLDRKLKEIEGYLEDCCRLLLEEGGHERRAEVSEKLRRCLKEIEKSCDRSQLESIKSRLARCISWTDERGEQTTPGDVAAVLKKCLTELGRKGGKEVFAKVYVKRGLHWAIMDVRKRFMGLGELLSEEREDGSHIWDQLPDRTSRQRSLVIREEISDCLGHLDEGKRRATMLALQGYRCSEIADFLNLSIPQAESRIRRGKASLRKCLKLKGVVP